MIRASAICAGIVLAAYAAPAAGQEINMSAELDELHNSVMALASGPGDFEANLADVARLHGAVAAIRSAGDPKRFQCLMDQASLLEHIGNLDAAQSVVALAADEAATSGQYERAARASVTASDLARRTGDFNAAERFRGRAEWFATSPTLTLEETTAIAVRLYAEQWRTAGGLPPAFE